jgi:hypothetical protein
MDLLNIKCCIIYLICYMFRSYGHLQEEVYVILTSGGRSVGIVRLQTEATGFFIK